MRKVSFIILITLKTEELYNALDEIKRNEKESNMIAMVASTLFEKQADLQARLGEVEHTLTEYENRAVTDE